MVSANQRAFVRTSALWAVYENFTATYLVAFALLLGASNIMVGVFGAIPFIAVLLSELIGAKLTEYWARVPIIVVTYAIDKTMWVLIALLPWFTLTNPLVVLVILYFINQFFITLREPSVVSLTADIVEERKRGAYFGRVNRATGAAALVATITAGWFITRMGDTSQLGYSLLFGAGALFGYAAMWSFSTMTEPRRVGNSHYTVKDVLRFDGSF
ncbi:MAG: MFS transporter, partial [Nanoarchaeota archaeon]